MKRLKGWHLILGAALLLGISFVVPVVAQHFPNIVVLDGSAGSPSMTFNSAQTRGFFNDTVNTGVGFAAGSNQVGGFNATALFLPTQVRAYPAPAPTCSGCGSGGGGGVIGTNSVMKATIGTLGGSNSITLTFPNTWTQKPSCVVTIDSNAYNGGNYVSSVYTTTTTVKITTNVGLSLFDQVNVWCPSAA